MSDNQRIQDDICLSSLTQAGDAIDRAQKALLLTLVGIDVAKNQDIFALHIGRALGLLVRIRAVIRGEDDAQTTESVVE